MNSSTIQNAPDSESLQAIAANKSALEIYQNHEIEQLNLLHELIDLDDLLATEERLSKLPDAAVHTLLGEMLQSVFIENSYTESRFLALLALERLANCGEKVLDVFLELERPSSKGGV